MGRERVSRSTSHDCATVCIHVPGRLIACPARYNRKFVTVSAANMPADRRPAPGSWSAAAVTLADFQATAPFATRRGLSGYLHPWAHRGTGGSAENDGFRSDGTAANDAKTQRHMGV